MACQLVFLCYTFYITSEMQECPHDMSGRHGKKKKKRHAPKVVTGMPNKTSPDIPADSDPEGNKGEIIKYSFPVHKPPDSLVALWALVTGIVVATIYGLQLYTMLEANRIARDNLSTSQRAFVSFSPNIPSPFINLEKEGSNDVRAWQFFIPITNSGSTPTRDLWLHAAAVSSNEPLDNSFNFHDFEGGERSFIGARDTTSYTTEPLKIEDILATRKGGMCTLSDGPNTGISSKTRRSMQPSFAMNSVPPTGI
ncbi:MAG TPA: hypothetical protein VKY85_03380 [Candidatus Angelobacter sp.]|nr:hypothetical protein [Candidatus Angelobacter sp.]